MNNWKTAKMGDVADIVMGQSPKGESCNTSKQGLPLLNGPTEYGIKYPIPVQYTVDPKRICKKGDILFCVRGSTTGRMNWADKEYAIGRGIAAIRHKQDNNINGYIKGLIDYHLPALLSGATGSVFPNITGSQLSEIPITLPPLPEQRAISGVLSSLDDKIDLLHRQNKTLESLAETLWRKMFVEDMNESWVTGKISDIIDVLSGFAFKSSSFIAGGKYRLVTIKAVQDGFIELAHADKIEHVPSRMPSYCLLRIGDILLSLTGNVGRCCLVDEDDLLLNQRVAKLMPRNPRDFGFAYCLFRQESMKMQLIEMAKGTAQANLSPIEMANIDMRLPPENILEQASEQLNTLIAMVIKHTQEIHNLKILRDALLPKLMSREARVHG